MSEEKRGGVALRMPSYCTACGSINMRHSEDGFTCSPMCHNDILKELKAKGDHSFLEINEREEKMKTLIENLLGVIGDPEGNCGMITCMDHIQKMADAVAIAFTTRIDQELVSSLEEDTKKIIKKIEEITREAEKLLG